MSFYEQLKDLRKLKGFTIREVSSRSGVSKAYISQLENGNRGVPSPEILKKLSSGLHISYDELMKLAGYIGETSPYLTQNSETVTDLRQYILNHHLMLDGHILTIEDKEWINQVLTAMFWKEKQKNR